MIFTVRQLLEMSWEHITQMPSSAYLKRFMTLFLALPCGLQLKKLGVPDHTMDIIRSFLDRMMAQIKLNGTLLEQSVLITTARMLHGSCAI